MTYIPRQKCHFACFGAFGSPKPLPSVDTTHSVWEPPEGSGYLTSALCNQATSRWRRVTDPGARRWISAPNSNSTGLAGAVVDEREFSELAGFLRHQGPGRRGEA